MLLHFGVVTFRLLAWICSVLGCLVSLCVFDLIVFYRFGGLCVLVL